MPKASAKLTTIKFQRDSEGFATLRVGGWQDFVMLDVLTRRRWIFRGHLRDYSLATRLERTLRNWEIDLKSARRVEDQMIRDFRRRLSEPTYHHIQRDTLYCLALMQHHGAPTRLLDCTYSPFVAASFALQEGGSNRTSPTTLPVLWCFNARWLDKAIIKKIGKSFWERHRDSARDDRTFLLCFK